MKTEAIQKLLQKEQQAIFRKGLDDISGNGAGRKDRIPIYEKFKNNELTETEYLNKKEEIQSQLQMYEMDLKDLWSGLPR